MATHPADVSVLFGVPAEPIPLPSDERLGSAGGVNAGNAEPTQLATWRPIDLIGLRLAVALGRLRDLGIPSRVKVMSHGGPIGPVIWQHPHAGSTVTVDEVVTLGVVPGTPVRVPDVVLSTESQARASLAAAGLALGRRNPEPRPVTGRSEVVIRTSPRVGSLVPAGSRVDYELLPGEPRKRTKPGAYVDYDTASSLGVVVELPAPDAVGADRPPYVDYDVIDTLFRVGRRPVGSRV